MSDTDDTSPPSDRDVDRYGAAPDGYRLTADGNARRLVEVLDGRARYVDAWGKWIIFTGGRWTVDHHDARITQKAKLVARHLFYLSIRARSQEERDILYKWAEHCESTYALAAMVKLARGEAGVLVDYEDLDNDLYILNARNGIVDLRTGRLRPHNPAALCTKMAPIPYDPDARSELWESCLKRWQPDPAMREYLQREAGAATTGRATETLSVHFGDGANGKTKFWEAIRNVLGDYSVVPHKSLLVAQRHEQHETVKADLFRARLAIASETKAGDCLDDEQVKAITGGDRQRARRMREDSWTFDPTHTIVVFSNHRPRVRGRDEAIWRRVRLVPWDVTIPEDERDEALGEKLRDEAPGILAWLVDGARRYFADRLTPPAAVRAATTRYRADEDTAGRFVAEVVRIGDGWCWSAEIIEALEAWAAALGVEPAPSMQDIAPILQAAGCTSRQRQVDGRRGVAWSGVTLETSHAEASQR